MSGSSVYRMMKEGFNPGVSLGSISVIVPIGPKETGSVQNMFDSVKNQDYSGSVETIAVCNGCPKEVYRIASKRATQTLRYDHALGFSGARNRGIEKASGDIMVFLDADTKMEDPNMLNNIAHSIESGYVGGTTNLVPDENNSGEDAFYRWTNLAGKYGTKLSNIPVIGKYSPPTGNGFIYYRSDLGVRFNEQLENNEDTDVLTRLRDHGKTDFLDGYVRTSGRRFRDGPITAWTTRAHNWLTYRKRRKQAA